MKKKVLLGLIWFFCTAFYGATTWAVTNLECVSNKNITYTNRNLVGGARPFPGMVTHIEEIKIDGQVNYRIVRRQECDRPLCELQSPELVDITPPFFTFQFYPATKQILQVNGNSNDPSWGEVYAIQFRINKMMNFWMLCDFSQIIAP